MGFGVWVVVALILVGWAAVWERLDGLDFLGGLGVLSGLGGMGVGAGGNGLGAGLRGAEGGGRWVRPGQWQWQSVFTETVFVESVLQTQTQMPTATVSRTRWY